MEKPFRYRKKLVKLGNSDYILLPADWIRKHLKPNEKEVIVEIYKDEIKVFPQR